MKGDITVIVTKYNRPDPPMAWVWLDQGENRERCLMVTTDIPSARAFAKILKPKRKCKT